MRIIVFTAGELSQENQALLRRLQDNRKVQLAGVVVDRGFRPRSLKRLSFLRRKWGWPLFLASLAVKVGQTLLACAGSTFKRVWHDRFIAPHPVTPGLDSLRKPGAAIMHVEDINSDRAVKSIAALAPDLGIILGGRILSDAVISTPKLGTLNIHKHDVHKYRGGAQTGYPERLNGDEELIITVHWALPDVDAGDIVATRPIPIERFDTAESLEIKASIAGARLYEQAILDVAAGKAARSPQDISRGTLLFSTPYWSRTLFWARIRRRREKALKPRHENTSLRLLRATYGSARKAAFQCCLPMLTSRRRNMEAAGQAPIIILYYHGIGNGADNWMTLPLEQFHAQLAYLRNHYRVLALSDAVERLRSGSNSETCAVLTFDDGYRSLHDNLLPYLTYHGIPATVFINPGSCAKGLALDHDLAKGYGHVSLMDEAQVRRAAEAGMEIGSHGMYHERMSELEGASLDRALAGSKERLESITGKPVRYFSFPHGGKQDMSPQAFTSARTVFNAAFSAYGGYNLPNRDNDFHFQRFSNPTSVATLAAIMGGLHRIGQPFYSDSPAIFR